MSRVPRETILERAIAPLLFRKEMRAANAAGQKTETRRIVTAENSILTTGNFANVRLETGRGFRGPGAWIRAQCTAPTWRDPRIVTILPKVKAGDLFWQKTGRFGSRRASELTLEVLKVDVARVQDMNDNDAMAEGAMFAAKPGSMETLRETYARLWDSINGRGSWAANPWVWIYRYRVHALNIDDFLRGPQQ